MCSAPLRARSRSKPLSFAVCALASPVTGGAVAEAGRDAQFFLEAMSHGARQPAELAAFSLQIFRAQGLAILDPEGKPLAAPADALAALTTQAALFLETKLPLLRALRVA